MNTKTIKLDINKRLYEKITAKQGDTKSRFLLFHLLDGASPFSLVNRTVRVYGLKPDKKEIFNDLKIVDANKGHCELELTNQALAIIGDLDLELAIYEGESKLTSIPFTVDVLKSINSTNAIESSNEYKALDRSLTKVEEWNNEFADKSGKLEQLYTERLNGFGTQLADITYFVTPEMYGAIGDGIADDTEALNRCIAENINGVIISKPNKNYYIKGTLNFTDYVDFDFNDSYLICDNIEKAINASNPINAEKIATIRNLYIDGRCKCKIGIYVTAFRILNLINVRVKDCLVTNIQPVRDSATGRGSIVANGLLLSCTNNSNLPLLTNSKAIILDSTDCKIDNVISNNFIEHIIVNQGVNFIKNWHAWNLNSSFAEIINNSKFAVINNSINFDNCYSDTLQHAFYCTKNVNWINVIVNNFYYYINASQYPSIKNEPLPIYNKGCILVNFNITNSVFNNEWNDFANINICNETFNVAISQSQLKGFNNQINVGKVKYRSFAVSTSLSNISIGSERILHIKDDKLFLSLNAGLLSQIPAGTDGTITITESTILSKYSSKIQNNIVCLCTVKNGNKIYNVNAFYSNNVFYLSFPETITGGSLSLVMNSNYNASETKVD